jgi:hypothetical protein
MRRGIVCVIVCAGLATMPTMAHAGPLGGLFRGITAAPRALLGGHGRHRHHPGHHLARRHAPTSPPVVREEPPAAREEAQTGSWVGAVYWPSAYPDTFGYILSGAKEASAFWSHGSGDIYDSLFVPAMASTAVSNKPGSETQNTCTSERSPPVSLDRIERTVHTTDAQRAQLNALRAALAEAGDRMRGACPDGASPQGPTARLTAMWDRLRALRQAVGLVRAPLKAAYEALNDEQKARLNAIPDASLAQGRSEGIEPQICAASTSSVPQWPAKQIDEAVRPTDQQRASLEALTGTTAHLSAMLEASCPQRMPLTPTGRLEAVINRLDSLIYVLTLERTAFNNFYTSLSDDQKASFDGATGRPPQTGDRRPGASQ